MVALRVDVFDETGAMLGNDDVRVRRVGLLASIVDACRPGASNPGDRTPGGFWRSPRGLGLQAVMEFARIMENTDTLLDLLWRVAKKPSLLSLLGGVRVSFGMWFERAVPSTHPLAQGDVYQFPFQVNVN